MISESQGHGEYDCNPDSLIQNVIPVAVCITGLSGEETMRRDKIFVIIALLVLRDVFSLFVDFVKLCHGVTPAGSGKILTFRDTLVIVLYFKLIWYA